MLQFNIKNNSKHGIKNTILEIQNNKSYAADRLRSVFLIIGTKIVTTLTIYQKEQLKRYQEATKQQRTINF